MTTRNPSSCPQAAPLHCQHRPASGRRFCRLPVSDPATGLCFKHAAQLKKDRDAANVAALLIGETSELTSAVAINRSLTELYKLLARDQIAPRRAAVMAYTCSLLLRTLPAIARELHPDQQDDVIIFDIPSAVATRAAEAKQALGENYGSYASPLDPDPSRAPNPVSTVSVTEAPK